MPPGVIAAVLLSALLHAVWNGLLRQSADRNWTVGWIGFSTFLVCAPFLPFVAPPAGAWPFVIGSSSLHIIYLGLLARAYRDNELSFAYPIARGSSPMLVALGALLVAAERPRVLQAVGIVLIVGGIAAIGLDAKHWDRRGFWIALLLGLVIATYTVIDGVGARRCGLPTSYNLWCFSIYGMTVFFLRLAVGGRSAFAGRAKHIGIAISGGATSVVAYAIVTWAMVGAPFGMVSALRETSSLFATAIGFIVLGERVSIQKLVGCVAIVAGAVTIGMS